MGLSNKEKCYLAGGHLRYIKRRLEGLTADIDFCVGWLDTGHVEEVVTTKLDRMQKVLDEVSSIMEEVVLGAWG